MPLFHSCIQTNITGFFKGIGNAKWLRGKSFDKVLLVYKNLMNLGNFTVIDPPVYL